jgi:uncharacterized OsmC-like protein
VSGPRAKVLGYSVDLDEAGLVAAESREHQPLPERFSPEHLALAAILRCTLASLRYHADRSRIELVRSRAAAEGRVTRRESDGRHAFVEIACDLEVTLDPPPEAEARRSLLAKAERDCFVGASFTAAPSYRWRVNGEEAP